MRSSIVIVLTAFATLGILAPPSFAQVPAPKVTINGLVDFVATAYKNMSYAANQDVTNNKEKSFYSRERGVFTFTGEIGKVKGVWAVELDFSNGAGNVNTSNNGAQGVVGVTASGTSANFDLDTDIQGAVETKWLYLEAPVTGKGSLLPFIPVETIMRAGGQPFRGHDYKPGVLATGDFPGVTLVTTWTPSVRSTVSYVQIGEALDRFIALNQKESIAVIASVEADIFKGLTVKPTYAYASYDGGNCGTSNLGTPAFGGYSPNTNCPGTTVAVAGSTVPAAAGSPAAITPGVGFNITRHYLGGDVRWTMGPFSFQPTFIYMLGQQEVPRRGGGRNDVDIRSFLLDSVAGFRTGPLNIETRIAYTPGTSANQDIQNGGGGVSRRYDAINPGFTWLSGWTEIWKGDIDYSTGLFVGRSGVTARESQSYDKYGRIFFAIAADYSLTPALTVSALTNVSWTDTSVDTKGVLGATGIVPSTNPFGPGLERYLGNEWVARMSYRFAPNMAFDLSGAVLFAGDALNMQRATGGCVTEGVPTCKAQDVWKLSTRFRVTF